MSTPILTTKLHIPSPRPNMVFRSRLIEHLNSGIRRKLTLVSAPAGFGKTTLVGDWITGCNCPIAWLSLDEGDADPIRFLTYVIAALQTIQHDIGEDALRILQSSQMPPIESILTSLLNEIATLPDNMMLVLDDYHVIDAQAIDAALLFLLEHLPAQLHLVITTREDPNLPLARLRVRGQLSELRIADLRFTPDEVAQFLNEVMGLRLSPQDITALEQRTEGWIAGLQLAAISMQGQGDTTRFIESFTGSHHFVLDYLVEEVLHRQPQHIQDFLLRTSILDRLYAPLCDAVLQSEAISSQEMLEYIDQSNLFLVSLDDERRWYRYHHLFADLLRQRVQQRDDIDIHELHRRASFWYEDNELDLDAFHHAALANDLDRVEHLIAGQGMPLYYRGAVTPVLNWLESLPTTVLNSRPSLWVTYASVLTFLGRQEKVINQLLQSAELALDPLPADDVTRNLRGQIASLRAMLGIPKNDIDTILTQSQLALDLVDPDNLPVRTAAHWTLGFAYQISGHRVEAIEAYTQAISTSQASGNMMITLAGRISLAQVQETNNQFHLAIETYQQGLELLGDPPLPVACEPYIGLARIYYEWDDLEMAQEYAEQSLQMAYQVENVDTPATCSLLLSRIKLARGDFDGASEALADATQFARQQNFTHRMPEIYAMQALIMMRQGNLKAASHLAQTYDLPIIQARVLLAQGNPSEALDILEPLYQDAKAKDWKDDQLKVRVLQSVAHYLDDDSEMAVNTLIDAMTLAEQSGFIRVFVDEGLPVAELLSEVAALGMMPDYVRKLRAAFDTEERGGASMAQPLIEPLSDRELEVLQLVSEGLSNGEIADRLFVALNTVKGHNRRIYGKLGVQRRTEAVARARELGLI